MTRLTIIAAAAMAASVSLGANIIFVKPDGTGAGGSWADAADLEAAATAAAAAVGETDLYLAQGLYYPSATVRLTDGVSLYGGFAGLSDAETPETRDLAATPSIISGDVNRDDTWTKYDGATGETSNLRTTPVIADGRLNLPQDLGEFCTVVPNVNYVADNLERLLVVAAGATCTIDGVVLQGGGKGDKFNDSVVEDGKTITWGGSLFVAAGTQTLIRNVRVFGSCANQTTVYFDGTSALPSTNLVSDFSIERSCGRRAGGIRISNNAWTTMTNCVFIGNARTCRSGGWQGADASAAVVAGDRTELHDCLFEDNVVINMFDGYVRAAAVLSLPYCGALRSSMEVLRGLVFRGNASYASKKAPFPLVELGIDNYKLNECVFEGNLVTAESDDPLAARLVDSGTFGGSWRKFTVMNSTFCSNTISVAAGSGTNVLFAAPVLARGLGQLVNCTFLDNTTIATAPEGVDVFAARGVIGAKLPGSDPAKQWCASCFNCVFAGSTPLPDVLDAGVENGQVCSFVANSVLWATGEAANTPRIAVATSGAAGAGNAVEVGNCDVKGLSLLGAGVTLIDRVAEINPRLCTLDYLDDGDPVPTMRCRGRKADFRKSYDIKHWDYYTQDVYCYFQGGSTTGGLTRDGRGVAARAIYIGDAVGRDRPAGAFTLGARQDLDGLGLTIEVK